MKIVVLLVVLAYAFAAPLEDGVALNDVIDGRIAGGSATTISKQPWQVSLQYLKRYICSGSIISKDWVVTAAHCTSGFSLSSFTIRSGSSYHNEGGTIYSLEKIVNHETYSSITFDYDIAVIKVAKEFSFGSSVDFIILPPDKSSPTAGEIASVAGWGITVSGGELSKQLRVAEVPIVGDTECKAQLGQTAITARMICAGAPTGGKGTCDGDGGSPLIVKKQLVGIASWERGCGVPQFPGVYTNVGQLRAWITSKTTI